MADRFNTEKLLNEASKRVGKSPEELKKQLLSKENIEKSGIAELLKDKEKVTELLESPQFKSILEKLK